MTDKQVDNDQWFVKDLISKINDKIINKPKFQRKKKWDIQPKNSNNPNEKNYILFLYGVKNSVHPITFGQFVILNKITYTNIDGNNRINAIKHFIDRPFEIFPEYLTDLLNFINTLELNIDDKNSLIQLFRKISYSDIMDISQINKIIKKKDIVLSNITPLKIYHEELDSYIEIIQNKLKINGVDRFDINVKINVNLFQGYTTDELCQIFEDINKYRGGLTGYELLACSLYNITDFTITDTLMKQAIINEIIEIYKEKSENEALDCYRFDMNDGLNAFDVITALQNHYYKKYQFVEKCNSDGLPLFFKIYKTIYSLQIFNTKNINDFMEQIRIACNLLDKVYKRIFTEQINSKLFNKTCETKIYTMNKTNIFLILSAIIGYYNKNQSDVNIINSIEKAILYHLFINDIKDKELFNLHKMNNEIHHDAGGAFIDSKSKQLLTEPNKICENITNDKMHNVIQILFDESYTPDKRFLENGNKKNDKRRRRKFFEKTLWFYYYKSKVPTNLLENKFSLEHICPFSSLWDDTLDIDRLGNEIPIIHEMNNRRLNKPISEYDKLDKPYNFIKFIDVIPSIESYDSIVSHKEKTPKIINNDTFNKMCMNNENAYIDNFMNCLFL
jgi:hypothetical protein